MSHPLRGDDLLSGIPAARRVLVRAPARNYSLRRLAVAGDRYCYFFRKGLSVNHTCKLSRRTSQVSALLVETLARLGIFFSGQEIRNGQPATLEHPKDQRIMKMRLKSASR